MNRFVEPLKELSFSLEKKAKDLQDLELEEMFGQLDGLIEDLSCTPDSGSTHKEGYEEGYDDGYEEGYEHGYSSGLEMGEDA